ncbi:adenine deaminase [Paradesulfitobacterium aromaticivorans]
MSGWKERMDQARGLAEVDLVLRRARLVNVFSGEVHSTDIGIHNGQFVGIGSYTKAVHELDVDGKYVVPGLIDGHVHIESSQLCPEELCSLLLAHGVTSAVVDPHEIANVLGVKGIRYMLDSLKPLPFNAFVVLPSCVPATELETSGARLGAEELREFVGHPQVIGLGEVMDYQSVIEGKADMVAKLELPLHLKDGHAPGISGEDLNAYFVAGIRTEHECTTPAEARERLRRGFNLMLREGSAAKNLLDLLPAVNNGNAHRCLFVTDDRHPADLLNEGSIDHLVRLAIKAGQPPVRAVQMGTINAAHALGLSRLGAVAPGYQADFLILSDLESFQIEDVYWHGQKMSSKGKRPSFLHASTQGLTESVNIGKWDQVKLEVKVPPGPAETKGFTQGQARSKVRVIGVQEHSLVTSALVAELPLVNGCIEPDPEQDIAKIAVLERHHATGGVGVGFIKGLGLKKGAVASTVAHDSHNLVVAGMSDQEMDLAIRTVVKMGGGLCLIEGEKVIGKLPLPLAGLMTDKSPEEVAEQLSHLHAQGHALGMSPDIDPFMTLAFMSLPVIPELKITDLGLVDVEKLSITKVFVD